MDEKEEQLYEIPAESEETQEGNQSPDPNDGSADQTPKPLEGSSESFQDVERIRESTTDGAEAKINIIIGTRGSGKSYLTKKLILEKPRMLIYDTQHEYRDAIGFEHDEYEMMLQYWQKHCEGSFRLAYRPADAMDLEEFDRIAALVFALGDMTFVCEEVHTYCQTNRVTPNFKAVLSRGRHKGIEVFCVTQRPFGIDRYVTSQAKRAHLFATNEPRDLQYIRDYFGYAVFNMMGRLGTYEHVRWTDGQAQIEKAGWTADLRLS